MFQTEPILWLQSWASPWLTALMTGISSLGYETPYAVLLTAVLAGLSFRRGFLLLQAMMWSALLNSALKDWCALPRPIHVDARVLDGGRPGSSPFTGMGATRVFGGLPPDIVAHWRGVVAPGQDEFGLPSGHVQSTTVLWGSLAVLFGSRAALWCWPAAVMLMGVSRMYLGRHFLADVLAGAALGIVVVIALTAALRAAWDVHLFDRVSGALRAAVPNLCLWTYLVAAPLAVLPFYPDRGGMMFGVNVAYLLIQRRGVPDDGGTLAQRAQRVGIGLLLLAATSALVTVAVNLAGLAREAVWVRAARGGLPPCVMLLGVAAAYRRHRGRP